MAQNVYFDLPRVHQAALQAQAMQSDMEERKLRRQELEQQRAQAERTKNIYAKAAEGAIDPVTGQIDEMKLNRNLERSMLSSGDVPGYMSLREKSRPNADMMKQIISNRGQIASGLASIAQEAGFENAQRVYREFVRPAAIAQEQQMGYQPRPEEWPDITSPEQLMAIAAQHKQAKGAEVMGSPQLWRNPKTNRDEMWLFTKEGQPLRKLRDANKSDLGTADSTVDAKTAFTQENQLRDQFLNLNKDFRQVRDSYSRIQEAAKEPSAAGDLALIFNYMKMLDPGSVVREGEFATAQNAAGVPDRIRAYYNKVIDGERLADATRKDFLSRSKMLYGSQNRQYQKSKSEFQRTAKQYGLDPSRVIIEQEIAEEQAAQAPARPAAPGAARPNELTFNPATGRFE